MVLFSCGPLHGLIAAPRQGPATGFYTHKQDGSIKWSGPLPSILPSIYLGPRPDYFWYYCLQPILLSYFGWSYLTEFHHLGLFHSINGIKPSVFFGRLFIWFSEWKWNLVDIHWWEYIIKLSASFLVVSVGGTFYFITHQCTILYRIL